MSLRDAFKSRIDREEITIVETPRLTEEMIKCHENNLGCIYVIHGRMGLGKSTFALKAAHYMEKAINDCDKDCCVNFDCIVFTLQALFKLAENQIAIAEECQGIPECIAERRLPYVIVDDATLSMSKYMQWSAGMKTVDALLAFIDTMRYVTSNLILTTPNIENIVKYLRYHRDVMLIEIKPGIGHEISKAVYWDRPKVSVSGGTRIHRRKLVEEYFRRYTSCYRDYATKRLEISKSVLEKFKQTLENEMDRYHFNRYMNILVRKGLF